MLLKTQGLVLKQRNIGENDRIITILSKELGIIEAAANGVKRIKSKLAGATQTLCYSEFCLYKGKQLYSINSAETIHSFYDLRLDVEKLSLAAYFCDLTGFLSPTGEGSWASLRLLLNTLALLEKNKRSPVLLKSIYELRILSMAGFMPDLTCCARCGTYESESMYFLPLEAKLLCGDCAPILCTNQTIRYETPPAVLAAMRRILYSDDDKVFAFTLGEHSLKQLSLITEQYVLLQTDAHFKSLDLYKQLSAV